MGIKAYIIMENIERERNMKIGATLSLTEKNDNFRAKIIDIDKHEGYLIIDLPIRETDGKTALLREGTYLRAIYNEKNENIYQFNTIIVQRLNQRIPAFVLKYPKEGEIEKIQRRQFVRIKTAVDVAISSSNNSFSPFTTVTTDISAGGMSIIIPKEQNLKSKSPCDLTLVLYESMKKQQYINVKGEIIRIHSQEYNINTASIKFNQLTNQQQQMIIRFCFEKQREARRKELT